MRNFLEKYFAKIVSTLLAGVMTLIAILKGKKSSRLKGKNATMTAYEDMYNQMIIYIGEVEKLGNMFKTALGKESGTWKLNEVIKDLKLYALTKSYDFDENYWKDQINSIVAFTKEVNVGENPVDGKIETEVISVCTENKQGVIKR